VSAEQQPSPHQIPLDTALEQHFQELGREEPPRELMEHLYAQMLHKQQQQQEQRFRPVRTSPTLWQQIKQNHFAELSTIGAAVMIFFMMQLPGSNTHPSPQTDAGTKPNVHAKVTPTPRKHSVIKRFGAAKLPPHTPTKKAPTKRKAPKQKATTEGSKYAHVRSERKHQAKALKTSGLHQLGLRKSKTPQQPKHISHRPQLKINDLAIQPLQPEKHQQALREHNARHLRASIQRCIENAKYRQPDLHGKMTISIKVGQSGTHNQFKFIENTIQDSRLKGCISRSIKHHHYPKRFVDLTDRMTVLVVASQEGRD
tara:strand:- start:1924 stop:2862 length:939 start_codon:yes stop_codon:yes gene_type:complete